MGGFVREYSVLYFDLNNKPRWGRVEAVAPLAALRKTVATSSIYQASSAFVYFDGVLIGEYRPSGKDWHRKRSNPLFLPFH